MTNNWADIGNATLVIAMGANPSENHPACMAHVNNARRGPGKYYDRAGNEFTSAKTAAKLVVIDPRKTRTAAQADMYVRIRPGTDIAFVNGLINYIIDATGTGTGLKAAAHANKWTRFKAFHEAVASKNHFGDAIGAAVAIANRPKYTDATFKVSGNDYERATFTQASPAATISNFPVATSDIEAAGTVYNNLKSHVAPYTPAVVADICGCSAAELTAVAELIIENSRCNSVAADTDAYSATINDPKLAGFRSTTLLYAMGITQHTCGSQNVKSFAVIQTLLGNMGRAGGGINALRGIHNVQGSTDMGLLYGNIPAYSGNPGVGSTFGGYMNALYGNRLNGTYGDGTITDPYVFANAGLQQKGFYSMTKAFFGDTSFRAMNALAAPNDVFNEANSAIPDTKVAVDALYGCWPKGNGDNHVKMFRKMLPTYAGTDKITACMVWGQNPAITEPNQSKIRAALKELDLLVCVDMFANETAMTDRKDTGVTYLIPACSHVEEAGSATNSGRVLQWRYQAVAPLGNSKTDLELLLRFAKALEGQHAFRHIKDAWATASLFGLTPSSTQAEKDAVDAWQILYGNQYGWTWGGAFNIETSAKKVYKQMCAPNANGGTIWIYLDGYAWDRTNRGGDWPDGTGATGVFVDGTLQTLGNDFPIRAKSRGKSDKIGASTTNSGNLLYKNWGYAWLVNRRVFYNNGDVPGDQADGFQSCELVSRMFSTTNSGVMDYSTAYRTYHRLTDKVWTGAGTTPAHQPLAARFPSHTEPYETPRPDLAAYWGYNSVVATSIAPGTPADGYRNLVPADSAVGTVDQFPLVLTSIRCVEHFQGGPITRNNLWNDEAEPEPWIEIHSADARKYGIKDGDWVNVTTARSNSTTDQVARTKNTVASTVAALDNFGKGFRARVGVGADENQRVAQGVVAIPWHWGESGLSTGARANDLCIDALDANTTIPESKACLCKIEKA